MLTGRTADIRALGEAAGIGRTVRVETGPEWAALVPRLLWEEGPWLVEVRCEPTPRRKNPRQALQDRYLQKDAFMAAARAGSRWA